MSRTSQQMISTAVNPRRMALIVATCLALSFFFFAPPFSQIRANSLGRYNYPRVESYLAQCADPLRRDIQEAMIWRLLPPLVCHALHLPGKTPLAVPWLGIVVATAYVAVLYRRRIDDWRFVAGGTLLFTTTSAILVPLDMPGFNDAWVWLGLLVVAFGESSWAVPLACMLCPWVDERFLIGFPLAWLVGRYQRGKGWDWPATTEALWLIPYAALRLWLGRNDHAAQAATSHFFATWVPQSRLVLPFVPIGWWMGLRAAWAAIAYAGWTTPRGWRLLGGATLLMTGVVSVVLAVDLSRSIAIITPTVLLGCFEYARRAPLKAPTALLAAGVVNLFLPAASVWGPNTEPLCPLPTEMYKWHINQVYGGGPIDTAISQSILDSTPENFVLLSRAYLQGGRFEQSLSAAREALRLRPEYADGYVAAALACRSLSRGDDAVAAAREALRLQPGNAQARGIISWADTSLKALAWKASQIFLKRMIKPPMSASFGADTNSGADTSNSQNWMTNTTLQPDGTYRVNIWMDTRDGSAAAVRTHFNLSLRYNNAGHWEVTEKPVATN